MFYKKIIRPFFFHFDEEFVHGFAMKSLSLSRFIGGGFVLRKLSKVKASEVEVAGLRFKNCVGLAAGFDKNAHYLHALADLGFGFIEIGTLTPRAQVGNPKQRLFRLPPDQAIINRMGFNNDGVDAVIPYLQKRPKGVIVGGNIGKNKDTPNEEAVNDYEICFQKLFEYVDYFVVNVSSPNTPGLRELQEKGPLLKILQRLQNLNLEKTAPKPIFLKIAPDLTHSQLDDIIEMVQEAKIAGVIATNTTVSREGLKTSKQRIEAIANGGLSGKPLQSRALEVVEYLSKHSQNAFPIIGVGGVFTSEDAQEMLKAGASLVQIYTGFIYEGPLIVPKILRALEQ